MGRTPWIYPLNLHVDYTLKLGEKYRMKAVADLFNVFNERKVVRVNQNVVNNRRQPRLTPNPDFLKPDVRKISTVPAEARIRLRLALV